MSNQAENEQFLGNLGVNEHHEKEIMKYMRFMRYQRGLRIKTIESTFGDFLKAKFKSDKFGNDDFSTFTTEEVREIVDQLKELVKSKKYV